MIEMRLADRQEEVVPGRRALANYGKGLTGQSLPRDWKFVTSHQLHWCRRQAGTL